MNLLEAMGHTALLAPVQDQVIIVSDIAAQLGIGVRDVNPLLIAAGFQTPFRDHKGRLGYVLTDEGKRYGSYFDTGKKHGDGTPVKQIKWYTSVVDVLR